MTRWVIRKKAELVQTVLQEHLTFEDACLRHDISPEELRRWIDLYRIGNLDALRSTRVQEYRKSRNFPRETTIS